MKRRVCIINPSLNTCLKVNKVVVIQTIFTNYFNILGLLIYYRVVVRNKEEEENKMNSLAWKIFPSTEPKLNKKQ